MLTLVLSAALAAALLLGLRLANVPRALRHRQAWSPLLAAALSLVVLAAAFPGSPAAAAWARLTTRADQLLARGGIHAGAAFPLGINLALLLGYLALKSVVHAPLRVARLPLGRFGVKPAYDPLPGREAVLRPAWVYPGLLFRRAGWWIGGALLAAGTLAAALQAPAVAVPGLPVLALLMLLETGWYLDGPPPETRGGGVGGRGTGAGRTGDYTALWEEYQRLWPGHLLAACSAVRLAPTRAAAPVVHRNPAAGDEVAQEVTRVWHDLAAAGHPLGDLHYHVLVRLWRGGDVLLTDADYAALAPVLFTCLHRALVDGHTALVLVPAARAAAPAECARVVEWVYEGLRGAGGGTGAWSVGAFGEFQAGGGHPHVLVAEPGELLERGATGEPWFGRLHLAVFLEGDRTVFEAPLRTDALMRVLRHRPGGLQQVVLSGDRAALESAMRDNLAGNPAEFRVPRPAPEAAFAIVWSLEEEGAAAAGELPGRFQDRVMIGPLGGDLGAEAVLALPAWRQQVSPIDLVEQEGLPWAEYVEELENHRSTLTEPVPASRLPGAAYEALGVPPLPHLQPRRERVFALARDRSHNLVATLRAWLPGGTASAFVHVVSPPYLLRDYLAANLEYFVQAPPLALSPRLADSRLAVVCSCLERLAAGALTEAEVLNELRSAEPAARYVEDTLTGLFREVLGFDPLQLNLLVIERAPRYDAASDRFTQVVTYRLAEEAKEHDVFPWLQRYRIVDRGEHVLGTVDRDHLYQRYLPGQVHAFQGKPYRVERVDHASRIVWVDHQVPDWHPMYRPVRVVTLGQVRPGDLPAERERPVEGGWEIDAELRSAVCRVETPGYHTFQRGVSLADDGHVFTRLDDGEVPAREYRDARVLRLQITPALPLTAAERDRLADTLAILFQEAFPTLFPETHGLLLACAPGSLGRWGAGQVGALMPLLGEDPVSPPSAADVADAGNAGDAENGADRSAGRGEPLVLYFVEDAAAPAGLAKALFDERRQVLALLEDYLSWVLEDEERVVQGWRTKVDDRGRFLRFGLAATHPALDLELAHRFLRRLLQERNTLREDRRAYYRGERRGGPGQGGDVHCDFCRRMLPADEFERLDDGRERCTLCRQTAVDTLPELTRALAEARRFLSEQLRRTVRRDVTVEFASAEEIRSTTRPFMPVGDFNGRALGVARQRGEHFSILVENGQPYHLTLGTIVHELTHIWQFTHLDFARMQADHGLLLIEGHAQWAELTCIRGMAPDYCEEEANRADVYGAGYRMIVEWARQHASLGDPFSILLSLYPAPGRS